MIDVYSVVNLMSVNLTRTCDRFSITREPYVNDMFARCNRVGWEGDSFFTLLEMPALSRPVAQGKAGPRAYEPRLVVPSV